MQDAGRDDRQIERPIEARRRGRDARLVLEIERVLLELRVPRRAPERLQARIRATRPLALGSPLSACPIPPDAPITATVMSVPSVDSVLAGWSSRQLSPPKVSPAVM